MANSDDDANAAADRLYEDATRWREHQAAQQNADQGAQQTAELMRTGGAAIGTTAPPPTPHPGQAGIVAFDEAMRDGRTRENAAAHVINRIIEGAIHGDERVLVRPWTDEEFLAGGRISRGRYA